MALAILATLAASAAPAAPATPSTSRTTVVSTSRLQLVRTTLSHGRRSSSYGWPVKPFDRQHPVRAFLDDPRIGKNGGKAFHFGIDIAVPDGTPVYAVEAGTVWRNSGESLAVVAPGRSRTFGYWHVVPVVKNNQQVARHQLIAYVAKSWGHVHFAERDGTTYVNPLRERRHRPLHRRHRPDGRQGRRSTAPPSRWSRTTHPTRRFPAPGRTNR